MCAIDPFLMEYKYPAIQFFVACSTYPAVPYLSQICFPVPKSKSHYSNHLLKSFFFSDDDDDDDEDDEPAASAAPAAVSPAPVAASPALTGLAASNVDYNAADYANAPGEAPISNDAVYDEEDQDLAPNTVTLVSNANNANFVEDTPQENAVSPSPSSTGDDDDEDEDDDDIDLSVEDDDEEDDDDTEDDDDEDDDDEDDDETSGTQAQAKRSHGASESTNYI